MLKNNNKQETPQCHETKFSTIQPRIDMTEIRNERWQWRNKRAQRALGRSPEEKVNGQGEAIILI